MFMFHIKTSFMFQLIKKKMSVKEKFERVALAVLCLSKVFNARLRNVICVNKMISTVSGMGVSGRSVRVTPVRLHAT